MDFIEPLSASASSNSILVVVDWFSKQAIFILTDITCTSADLAQLFIINIFSKHSVPSHVTCDHGSEFIVCFFHSLEEALDMHIHFTSSYHSEADGQTEQVNQTLEQYLCTYCNYQQDNWAPLLLLAEFAYNNTLHVSTKVSLFFANKSYNPSITGYPDQDITSEQAHDLVTDLDTLHQELRQNITTAQHYY